MKTIITSTEALKINQVKQLELINQKVTTKKSGYKIKTRTVKDRVDHIQESIEAKRDLEAIGLGL
jgi:hypothetical protein